ncbi:unnamed protein product [Lepidochelys kempii]
MRADLVRVCLFESQPQRPRRHIPCGGIGSWPGKGSSGSWEFWDVDSLFHFLCSASTLRDFLPNGTIRFSTQLPGHRAGELAGGAGRQCPGSLTHPQPSPLSIERVDGFDVCQWRVQFCPISTFTRTLFMDRLDYCSPFKVPRACLKTLTSFEPGTAVKRLVCLHMQGCRSHARPWLLERQGRLAEQLRGLYKQVQDSFPTQMTT